jgi:Fic family protein
MSGYIHQLKSWPSFTWEDDALIQPLTNLRFQQGHLLGKLAGLGFQFREETTLATITQDVIKSSEIEGELLPVNEVRSSIARRLGIEIAGEVSVSRNVDGVVEMMLDATQNYDQPLTPDRLFAWHAALFPSGQSGMQKITIGIWRQDSTGPMQVVSGPIGKECVHYEAPPAVHLDREMHNFLSWFNSATKTDPILKAAIAHFWFVSIHPFDDGNGRIARAIADMQLARADGSKQRFYSMSAQIQQDRKNYYSMLEETQKGNLDITPWLLWFIACLNRAIALSDQSLDGVMQKESFWEQHRTTEFNDRQLKMLNKLIDGFTGKLTTSKWAKTNKCSADTALRDIQDLISKEILEKEEGGGRSTSYRIRRHWITSK